MAERLISYDDGYSPPKTVEQARNLDEDDEVHLEQAYDVSEPAIDLEMANLQAPGADVKLRLASTRP